MYSLFLTITVIFKYINNHSRRRRSGHAEDQSLGPFPPLGDHHQFGRHIAQDATVGMGPAMHPNHGQDHDEEDQNDVEDSADRYSSVEDSCLSLMRAAVDQSDPPKIASIFGTFCHVLHCLETVHTDHEHVGRMLHEPSPYPITQSRTDHLDCRHHIHGIATLFPVPDTAGIPMAAPEYMRVRQGRGSQSPEEHHEAC